MTYEEYKKRFKLLFELYQLEELLKIVYRFNDVGH